jgi:hypothetical protein
MAVDIKSPVMNKWTLAAAGAGGGYLVGRKYIKRKHGTIYGTIGGALAGYIAGRILEPKAPATRVLTEAEVQAAAAQIARQRQQQIDGDGMGDYVDMDDDVGQDPVAYAPPGASAYAQRSARVQRDTAAAMRRPPRSSPENTEDLSAGWNGDNGSLGGGLGDYADDRELDELIENAKGGN